MELAPQPVELQPVGTTCACVAVHRPPSVQFERHHIWPKEFGGPTVDENLVYICATTHNTVHAYIRAFLDAGRALNWNELRVALPKWNYTVAINGYAYDLAVLGYERMNRGSL